MTDTTEVELFDVLINNFKSAASDCELLSKMPFKGPAYIRIRDALKLAEGAARQVAHWREDSRWLQFGLQAERMHQIIRQCLADHVNPKTYLKCAMHLHAWVGMVEQLRHAPTGHIGPILPEPGEPTELRNKPVQVRTPVAANSGSDIDPEVAAIPADQLPGWCISDEAKREVITKLKREKRNPPKENKVGSIILPDGVKV